MAQGRHVDGEHRGLQREGDPHKNLNEENISQHKAISLINEYSDHPYFTIHQHNSIYLYLIAKTSFSGEYWCKTFYWICFLLFD